MADKKTKMLFKWTGGKGQLLGELHKRIDPLFDSGAVGKYVEPFIGGGALMWDLLNRGDIQDVYIGDMNAELVNTYRVVKDRPQEFSSRLAAVAKAYLSEPGEEARAKIYYAKRSAYNKLIDAHSDGSYDGDDAIESAVLFAFLNRTCFNGLYRVNKDNHYNVPFGKYKNPPIDQSAQIAVNSAAMNKVAKFEMAFASYEECLPIVTPDSLVYLDPPYRPLPGTPSFTSYAKSGFNDDNQRELARFCRDVDALGAKFMLSNSDPHNTDPSDDFFDNLYAGFTIERVHARRSINSNGSARGKITEILVRNF